MLSQPALGYTSDKRRKLSRKLYAAGFAWHQGVSCKTVLPTEPEGTAPAYHIAADWDHVAEDTVLRFESLPAIERYLAASECAIL